MRKSLLTSAAFGLAFFVGLQLAVSPAEAALISWGAAQDVNTANSSQLSTNGTLVDAVSLAYFDVPVGTVTFYRRTIEGSPPTVTFADPGPVTTVINVAPGYGHLNGSSFATVGYGNLFAFSTNNASPVNNDFVISGLTAGSTYQVQIFMPIILSDYSLPSTSTFNSSLIPVTLNAGIDYNPSPPADIPNQFVLGTFVADVGGSQTIAWNGQYFAALQVRDITPAPEPSAVILLGFGSLGMLRFVRRRQKQQVADQVAK